MRGKGGRGALRSPADVSGVPEEALPAAFQFEGELCDRHVGDFEGVADAAELVGVDPPREDDVDLAVQFGDQVGQLAFGVVRR